MGYFRRRGQRKGQKGREKKYIRFNTGILHFLILDLSREIKQYFHKEDNIFEKGYTDFEKDLVSVLVDWGISSDDLKPQYEAFIKKAKKHLRRNLSASIKPFTRKNTKKTYRRDSLIFQLHSTFKEYTDINQVDIMRYIACLLIAFNIEEDSLKKVFEKTQRAYYRYPQSPGLANL